MHETYVFNKKRKNLSKTESGERTEQRTTSSRRNKNQKATWGKNQYQLYFFFGLLLFTGRSFEKPLNGVFIYFFKVPEFHLSPLVYYGTAVYCRLVKNRKFEEYSRQKMHVVSWPLIVRVLLFRAFCVASNFCNSQKVTPASNHLHRTLSNILLNLQQPQHTE